MTASTDPDQTVTLLGKPDRAKESAQQEAEDVHRRALMKLPTAVSPQTAAALQATENAWRRIRTDYGVISSTDVATLLGPAKATPAFTARLRNSGRLIGVMRNGRYEHPGFQFDLQSRRVKPIFERLLQFATSIGWDHLDLVLWLGTPTTYFEDERTPLEHLDDDNLLEIFEAAATVTW